MAEKQDSSESEASNERKLLPLRQAQENLDLSELPEEERVQLHKLFVEGLIEANTRAAKLGAEAKSLKENLRTTTDTAREAAQSGAAVTVSHVQETESVLSGREHRLMHPVGSGFVVASTPSRSSG